MMTSDRSFGRRSRRSSLVALIGALAAAVALSVLSESLTERLKHAQQRALLPAEQALAGMKSWWRERTLALGSELATVPASGELAALRRRNAELETALALALGRANASPGETADSSGESLLVAGSIGADVLGRQARSFLQQTRVISAGQHAGVLAGALVLDERLPLVDQGGAAGLDAGQLVLVGRSVWGQIASVGEQTATVRRASDLGYRDLVQLARADGERFLPGPRGVLEGAGSGLCRVRLVPTTEAVSEGDVVIASGGEGWLRTPLVYGRLSRIECTAGAAYWELWMQPAAEAEPQRVCVLRPELNRARLESATKTAAAADDWK